MDRIPVSSITPKPLVDAKGLVRNLRREEARLSAFVMNMISMRLLDLGRVNERDNMPQFTEAEHEIYVGVMALMLKVGVVFQPELNGNHEAPELEEGVREIVDQLRGIPPRDTADVEEAA